MTDRSSRRALLGRAAGLAALGLPAGGMAPPRAVFPQAGLFDESAICRVATAGGPAAAAAPGPAAASSSPGTPPPSALSPCPSPATQGIFDRHNLDVELINFGGSTDQLLEAIATGKADAGVGMALRWLKPLEQGFDVKITAGTHGGCMRLLAARMARHLHRSPSLKGKTIATADMAAPDKNFFSILPTKQGIDPDRDVDLAAVPGRPARLGAEKGEAHALARGDPLAYIWREATASWWRSRPTSPASGPTAAAASSAFAAA